MEDIEVIELETTEDNLFSSVDASAYVTHSSIVILNDVAIYQFKRDGTYLRKLAEEGNGPREFTDILYCFVDEDADILHYIDWKNQKEICCIDLKTGLFLESEQIDLRRLSVWCFQNDQIFGFPKTESGSFIAGEHPDSYVIAFQFDLNTDKMQKYYGNHNYTVLPIGNSMVTYGNHVSLWNSHYADTIYKLENGILSPSFILKLKNKMIDFNKGGDGVRLLVEYKGGFIIEKNSTSYRMMEDYEVLLNSPEGYLLIDSLFNIHRIEKINIDPLFFSVDLDSLTKGGYDHPYLIDPFLKVNGCFGNLLLVEQGNQNPRIIIGKLL